MVIGVHTQYAVLTPPVIDPPLFQHLQRAEKVHCNPRVARNSYIGYDGSTSN